MSDAKPEPGSSSRDTGGRFRIRWIKMLIPPVIVVVGLAVMFLFIATRPEPPRQVPKPSRALVQVVDLVPEDHRVIVRVNGTVMPARQVVIKSRVSGEVVEVHPAFQEGGLIAEGETLVRVDAVDYELALEAARSRLAQAVFEEKLEEGRRNVALREWELLKRGQEVTDAERDLALRVPHRERVEAELAAAEAGLKKAEVDLARTTIAVPFDALVLSRHVERGGQLREQDPVATLVDRSEYWVKVSVPADRLSWIAFPDASGQPGSGVELHLGTPAVGSVVRTGTVLRLLGDLEAQGRMAQVLVSIRDPLADRGTGPQLLLGSYVHADIHGREVKQVYRIPRSSMREGNRVWIAGADDRLEFRTLVPVWRDREIVLVRDGFNSGDRLVISDLKTPIPGMPMTVEPVTGTDGPPEGAPGG